MARAQQDISSPFTFVKGLITETNKLSEPDNSASDMLNVEVDQKGTAKKRRGLEYEANHQFANTGESIISSAVTSIEWKNVNGDPSKNYLVLQIGTKLVFYSLDGVSVSSNFIGEVDFSSVCVSIPAAEINPCEGKALSLGLVIVNLYADPFVVLYDNIDSKFVLSRLTLKIRDFNGLPDGLRVDENYPTTTCSHYYNLQNQGWIEPGDSGLLDSTGNGTDGGVGVAIGGGTIPAEDDFFELPDISEIPE